MREWWRSSTASKPETRFMKSTTKTASHKEPRRLGVLVSWWLIGLWTVAGLACTSGHAGDKDKSVVADRDLVTVQKVDYPVLVSASGVLEAEKNVTIGPPRIPNEPRF